MVLLSSSRIPLAASAADLKDIKRRGHLVIGVKDDLPPLGFKASDGQLEGLEIDLAHWLAKELLGDANAVVLQPLANQERIPAVLDQKVDLVIARFTATASRARLVNFSIPYYMDGMAFVTSRQDVQSVTQLRQQPIAVLNGSDTIANLRFLFPDAHLVGVDSYEQAKTLLDQNQALAFAADASVLTGWIQEYPQYHLLPAVQPAEPLVAILPKGVKYIELVQQVDDAIVRWQVVGMLRQRVLHWGLPEAGIPPYSRLVPYINNEIPGG